MKNLLLIASFMILLGASSSDAGVMASFGGGFVGPVQSCGQQLGTSPVIFCDTFDVPRGIGNRSGDLDGNVWGVSRATGQVNFGQGWYNFWNPTNLVRCDGTSPQVMAPNDVIICNGQVREASNDNNTGMLDGGNVHVLAMYPKQPFDFAGRTGTVSFDIANDTGGFHSAWPEFWMSDLPIPVPFNHFDSWQSLPANGFGIRMSNEAAPGVQGTCPNANNISQYRWTVESAVVVHSYVMDDTEGYGPGVIMMTPLDCVTEPPTTIIGAGTAVMNHVEIRVSTNQIDVYATDAGVAATPATLKHIAVINNVSLSLTRGLVWLEDAHYNADKGQDPSRASQHDHTFAWDNVAFDGPFVYRDFSYDALDALQPVDGLTNPGSENLGQIALANQQTSWNINGMPATRLATAARVLFGFNAENNPNPTVLNVTVNGNVHSVPWPYPDELIYSWRTFAVTIPLTDLVTGTNVVQLGGDVPLVFSNVNIVLVDVTNGVPVLPGSNNQYPNFALTTCNITGAAFCDTFDEGPASPQGRGGDLDHTKWAVGRMSGEVDSSGLGTANPDIVAIIPACRSTFTQTSVFPPNDTLICDASGPKTPELMTVTSIQNYGTNSYMIRQPFDFAGRVGKIDFDVDAVSTNLGPYPEIDITDEPIPAPNFREFNNYEVGLIPKNALILKLENVCGNSNSTSVYNMMVYSDYAGTIITPTFDHVNGCINTLQGSLNHFEIQMSETHIDVYGSDYSTDNEQTFPNFKLIYSADYSLPFTRGYVHIAGKNHASIKYGLGYDNAYHWDNVGFDGPVITAPRAYEIPDNTTTLNYGFAGDSTVYSAENLGWQLLDSTTGKTPGIYDPTNLVNHFTFTGVNIAGVTTATLTLDTAFSIYQTPSTTWGISYRFNGGTWRTVNLTSDQVTGFSNATEGGFQNLIGLAINTPVADLVQGTNTIEFLPVNAPMDYPPVIANIDLLLQ